MLGEGSAMGKKEMKRSRNTLLRLLQVTIPAVNSHAKVTDVDRLNFNQSIF